MLVEVDRLVGQRSNGWGSTESSTSRSGIALRFATVRLVFLGPLLIGCGADRAVEDAPRPVASQIDDRCHRVAERLRDELASRGEVVVREPFVLAGDVSSGQLVRWYQQTIQPAAQAMHNAYFTTAPDRPITILLCSREASYRDLADHLFADRPDSSWGYYKPGHRTLLVNLQSGFAGVGHELTHALMDVDFPAAPFWFREGMAGLHESYRHRETAAGPRLEGLVEGRWKAMRSLMEADRLLGIAALLNRGRPPRDRAARRYAQARFLCLFLQQRHCLERYYRCLKRDIGTDPQGIRTLLEVLQKPTLDEVDRDYRSWLEGLRAARAGRDQAILFSPPRGRAHV